jgi:phage/plasmid primase-like uncharacterized protein
MTVVDFNQWRADTAPHPEINYPALTQHALSRARDILEAWLPGGLLKGREYVCASIKGGKGTSCSTNILTGAGSDFASGEAWGDLVDLVAKCDGIPMHEAAGKVARHIGVDLTKPLPALPPVVTASPEEKYLAGRENVRRLLEQSIVCPPAHEYLVRKSVRAAEGVVLHEPTGNLLVPLYDEHGQLWSVQRIFPDGTKKINDGGRLSGNFFLFQGRTDTVYLAEGYATAATVHELTGATTVMGVSSGNLPGVAEVLARMCPTAALVVAGDADEPGRKCAAKAIERAPRFRAIFPPVEGQDWNDFGTANPALARQMLSVARKEPMLVDVNAISLTEPDFLVEDAIETPGTGMIFGASGSGKSFVVLDIALHCATGVPWLGKVVKEGLVIYLCGEGRHAIPRRVAAWRSVHGAIPDGRFLMSQRRVQFDPDSVCEMAGEINALAERGEAPVLIVIDTMARALPGDCDENSAKDTMAFVDMCDRLQAQYNCVVLIIHHTGHAEGANKRARGSSALKGAMDLEILLDADRGVIEWMKTKDSEPHLPIKYELVKTSYGAGPRDNSCIVKYDVRYDPTTEQMTKPAKIGAQTLSTLCHKVGASQVSEDAWREEFYVEYGGAQGSKKKAFQRAKDDLEGLKYIEIRGRVIHVKSVNVQDDTIEQAMFGHLLNGKYEK